MSHSRLPIGRMRITTRQITRDHYRRIVVWRGQTGSEVRVVEFEGRIAPVSRGTSGRDVRRVQGDSSPQQYVVAVEAAWGIVKGDEMWADADGGPQRYRVVAVDSLPHGQQAILEFLQ